MLCIKNFFKRWCKKDEKSPFQEFIDKHTIEKKDMKLKEKLLNNDLESITIIV